ncbi:MAG: hypothetical protein WCT04_08125, partial [Planctomycetota bacterium]
FRKAQVLGSSPRVGFHSVEFRSEIKRFLSPYFFPNRTSVKFYRIHLYAAFGYFIQKTLSKRRFRSRPVGDAQKDGDSGAPQ